MINWNISYSLVMLEDYVGFEINEVLCPKCKVANRIMGKTGKCKRCGMDISTMPMRDAERVLVLETNNNNQITLLKFLKEQRFKASNILIKDDIAKAVAELKASQDEYTAYSIIYIGDKIGGKSGVDLAEEIVKGGLAKGDRIVLHMLTPDKEGILKARGLQIVRILAGPLMFENFKKILPPPPKP
ncbi:MAG: hypothetical protein HQK56_20615 [Deltaproteobacteria bacterium]|nr:hypothetical protein [Deltaproteobacteria bacterium]